MSKLVANMYKEARMDMEANMYRVRHGKVRHEGGTHTASVLAATAAVSLERGQELGSLL